MIIKINEIQLFGYHGLYEEEKENGQNFIISLSIDIDYMDKNDIIDNTIDYTKILNEVKDTFNQKRYNLIESLAVAISDNLMRDKKINFLDISIKKESPPIDAKLNSVEVNLRKTR